VGTTEAELRREAETQRSRMGDTLDAIGDRLSPERMVERRKAALGQRFTRVKETVMGSPQYLEPMTNRVTGTVDAVKHAPEAMTQQARGNPIAAGIVAFGAGMLFATVLPKTETERRVAREVQPMLDTAMQEAKEVGREMAEDVKGKAKDAADEVKSSANQATERVRIDARQATEEVKNEAR
jgi:gas vesicle protein